VKGARANHAADYRPEGEGLHDVDIEAFPARLAQTEPDASGDAQREKEAVPPQREGSQVEQDRVDVDDDAVQLEAPQPAEW
jgi:hypothetical protein